MPFSQELEDLLEQSRRAHAEQLAAAKVKAAARGKEPFDLDKLEQLCDTSHEGRMAPRDERYAEYERRYYVTFSDVMTIEDFAKDVEELNRW